MNPDASIEYPKSQYKKFIKDVVMLKIDLIEDQIKSYLSVILIFKNDKLLKIILFAAIFELPNTTLQKSDY